MKLPVLAPLALLASTALATCHGDYTDALWNKDQARADAKTACNKMKGNFGSRKTKSYCTGNKDKKGYDFSVTHLKDGDRDLGYDECYDGLQKEIGGCERGGDTYYKNWEYGVWAVKAGSCV
ncbi:multicatalytic endopeptidase [Hypoxylon texense]